jgi:HSP20 family protein
MFATRWEPLVQNPLNGFHNEFNQLFDRLSSPVTRAYPAVNLWEDDDNIFAEAELPGLNEENLEIFVSDHNQLTIQGERKLDENQRGSWHRRERGFGRFSRVFTLPAPVDAESVEARLESGVLTLTLPKSVAAKPRKIAVKAN